MAARQLQACRAKARCLAEVDVRRKQRAPGGPEQHALREADKRVASDFNAQFAVCQRQLHAVRASCCLTARRSFEKKLDGAALLMLMVGV